MPGACAAIEALLEPRDDDTKRLGAHFEGWKHLVHGLVSEHPEQVGWFAGLLRRHGGRLDGFDFLPALARTQRAEAIEALAAEGVSSGRICLMLLAADDRGTRAVGRKRLAGLLRADATLPLLPTRYEDDAPFTARAVLAGPPARQGVKTVTPEGRSVLARACERWRWRLALQSVRVWFRSSAPTNAGMRVPFAPTVLDEVPTIFCRNVSRRLARSSRPARLLGLR